MKNADRMTLPEARAALLAVRASLSVTMKMRTRLADGRRPTGFCDKAIGEDRQKIDRLEARIRELSAPEVTP